MEIAEQFLSTAGRSDHLGAQLLCQTARQLWKDGCPIVLGDAGSEVPPNTPPRTLRRLRRLGDRPSTIGEPSGTATAPQDDPSGPRVIKTVLRFPSEEYLLAADRPTVPEQQITLTGPLAKAWEDARLRIALMTPSQLGDSNLQQATGVYPLPC